MEITVRGIIRDIVCKGGIYRGIIDFLIMKKKCFIIVVILFVLMVCYYFCQFVILLEYVRLIWYILNFKIVEE